MFCPQCGKQLPDNAKFCSKCGTAFGQPQPVQSQPPRPGAGTTGPGQVFPGGARGGKGIGDLLKGKTKLVAIAAAAVVVVIAAILLLRGCGGGGRFYQADRFMSCNGRQMLSELERHQGLKYKSSYDCWSGKPKDAPFGERVSVSLYDDDGDALDDDDLADGDQAYRMVILWEKAEIDGKDTDDPEVALDVVIDRCGLGKAYDHEDDDYYADAIGETTINGEEGFWYASVYHNDGNDDNEYSVTIYVASFDTMGFDDIEDAADYYGL